MLAVRDGCTSNNCTVLALLQDPGRVRANLSDDTLDRYLDHYLTAWAQSPGVPVADGAPLAPGAAQTADGAAPPRKSALNVDFPSSDSIPAISIMNPEPKGGTPTPAAAAAAVAAGQQTSAKVVGPQQMPPMPGMPAATASQSKEAAKEATREAAKEAAAAKGKRKQAANPPAQTASQAPAQAAPLDPVWNPGATLASPSPAPQPAASVAPSPASASLPPASSAPANSASSGVPLAGMPVQLTPFTSPQGQ
jgi:hypothetical protein